MNRVVRSTSVPMAELPSPRMRSPSQWPGTARSSTSAGRSLIMISGLTNFLPRASRPRPRHAQRAPGAQARGQFAAQSAAALHVERLIDRFVRDPHRLIIGIVHAQAVRDLLRAPAWPNAGPCGGRAAARPRERRGP